MDENSIDAVVQASVKTVLSDEKYSEEKIMNMLHSDPNIASVMVNLTRMNMDYTTSLVKQVVKELHDAGYLRKTDEET